MLKPKLFSIIKHRKKELTKQQLIKDVVAGIIVGVIALPLSIALAISSGVTPEAGLYTAIIAGFIISFLGGSRVQIGGPTGAFVVIVYGIIQKYGLVGLGVSTIMAGIILVIMGLLRLGTLIKFIPRTITIGFTSGIAIVLFSTQVKDLLGLNIKNVPADFLDKWICYIENMGTTNITTLGISILSILIIVIWGKFFKKIPGSLIAIIVTTIIVSIFNLNVETIGSKFGEISSALPSLKVPVVNLQMIKELISPAITIAILAAIESLLSAVVADGMIGKRHNSNMELIAQGLANICSSLFGGIPATGAIARTAANIKNGGRTPIAGIVHAVTLLLILIVLMPYAKLIPLATLGGILAVVAYNMSEWREFKHMLNAPRADVIVMTSTFILTVFVDLVVAMEVGMIFTAFLFMKRMAEVTNINLLDDRKQEVLDELIDEEDDPDGIDKKRLAKHVAVYEINGPFFFGATDKFIEVMSELHEDIKVLILKMRNVPAMDATAYNALYEIYERCEESGIRLIISNIDNQPMKVLKQYKFTEEIGKEYICKNLNEAIDKSRTILCCK